MTLRDDVRHHFDREAGRFPTPAGLRASVTNEATRGVPLERRPAQWAAAVAVVLAVAIVAALLAAGQLRNARVSPAASSPRAQLVTPIATVKAGPIPTPKSTSGMTLVDADMIDATHGWALLYSLTPGTNQRQFWVSRKTNLGSGWSSPVKVGPPLAEGDSGHHIHFVSSTSGFVYGSSTAFVTHDGGQTWQDSGLPFFLEVVAVVGRSPSTWVVTYPCAKGTVPACPYEVYISHDDGRTWAQSWALPGNISPLQVVAFQYAGLLISSSGAGDMYTTSDAGVTWRSIPGQCSPETFENYVATADGTEIWQYCGAEPPLASPPPNPPVEKLVVSTDGGATWTRKTAVGGVGVGAVLVSPKPGQAVLAYVSLQVSTDRGSSWKVVSPKEGFTSIVFSSSAEGWAVGSGAIWVSFDDGADWSPLDTQP